MTSPAPHPDPSRRIHPTPATASSQDLGFVVQRPMRHQSPAAIVRLVAAAIGSTLFGTKRERHDPVGEPLPEYAHPELIYTEHAELWLDFVADTGDGFDATYTVARALAAPQLQVGAHTTERGNLLVLCGDLVYPLPSRRAYRDHLVGPYRAALPVEDAVEAPDAVALPGSNDWIDELAAFRTTFTQGGWFGSWRLRQTRSYIAIALPHRYWLWGIDVGLGVDVEPQRKYFQDAARKLVPGDRVILCGYHPLWQQIDTGDLDQLQMISGLISERGAELVLQLSGKQHYYARYRYRSTPPTADEPHAIICGGGAYLGDSSAAPERVIVPLRPSPVTVERQECYPTRADTRKIVAKGLAMLPVRIGSLALVSGLIWSLALYGALSGVTPADVLADWPGAFGKMFGTGLVATFALSWVLNLVLARQGRPQLDRLGWIMGTAHWVAHCMVACTVALCVASREPTGWHRYAVLLGVLSASTAVVLVVYLALAWLGGQHRGEILPTLGVQDWKSFVRLHIGRDATLRIYPVGIPEVPRDWQLRTTGAADRPWFEHAGDPPMSSLVTSIHEPIVVEPNQAQIDALTHPVPVVRDPPYDVFISYSRADAAWVRTFLDAVRVALAAAGLTDVRVFIDTESLRIREYWRTRILGEIQRCSLFVAVWSPAYFTAWSAGGMCFEEYEYARRRAHGDPELVFDIHAKEINREHIETRHITHLARVAPDELPSAPEFKNLCEAMAKRIRERRAASARTSP